MSKPVRCGNPGCRNVLDESENLPYEERQPCPKCGSLARLYGRDLAGEVQVVGTLTTAVVASAAAAVYAAAKMLVRPPSPEPGYHPTHKQGDVVGESILFGLAVAGLAAFSRGMRIRWGSTFRFQRHL
jgi:hypothetical protein